MDLPIRIAAWRQKLGLPMRALAEACEVTVSAVAHWESGKATPSSKHLTVVVVDVFGITMQRFYGRIPTPTRRRAA